MPQLVTYSTLFLISESSLIGGDIQYLVVLSTSSLPRVCLGVSSSNLWMKYPRWTSHMLQLSSFSLGPRSCLIRSGLVDLARFSRFRFNFLLHASRMQLVSSPWCICDLAWVFYIGGGFVRVLIGIALLAEDRVSFDYGPRHRPL